MKLIDPVEIDGLDAYVMNRANAAIAGNLTGYQGQWIGAPESLVYSQDFSVDTEPFSGSNTRVAMSSAVGLNKPAGYAYVDEGYTYISGGTYNKQQLLWTDIPELVGRTPTRLKVQVGYRQKGYSLSATRTGTFQMLLNGTVIWSKSITTTGANQVINGNWESVEVTSGFSPTDTFLCRIYGGASTGPPQGWLDITGFELYAAPLDWTGYKRGDSVTYKGRMFISEVADNLFEPTVAEGVDAWTEVPWYIAPNAQIGTAYELTLDDTARVVTLTNIAASTLTIPTNASAPFPLGTRITVIQGDVGGVTFTPAAGVTLNNNSALAAQWAKAELIKTGTDTWVKT